MQYFAVSTAALKSKLLFYLVTEVFAQSVSGFRWVEICDTVREESRLELEYAVEHVLAYSGAVAQVPYNQHLGPGSDERYQRCAIRRDTVL